MLLYFLYNFYDFNGIPVCIRHLLFSNLWRARFLRSVYGQDLIHWTHCYHTEKKLDSCLWIFICVYLNSTQATGQTTNRPPWKSNQHPTQLSKYIQTYTTIYADRLYTRWQNSILQGIHHSFAMLEIHREGEAESKH